MMCASQVTASFLRGLPKCEHHLHIEGSLSPSLLFQLAKKNNIALPASDPAFENPTALLERYNHFTDLNDFLSYYYIGMSVLLTASDFENLAYEYFKRAHTEGVLHAEIFFDPQAHTERGIMYGTVVEGLVTAQQKAEVDFGLTSKLILCFLRHLPASGANEHFAEADRLGHFSDGTVAGIGLDSSEVGFPPEIFQEVFTLAKEKGIKRTAHAGEEGDHTYISRALDLCHTQRIDHGLNLVQNSTLLRRVAEENILVTLCPISNVQLRCVKHVCNLPIRRFLDEGVRFSINSDDPAYFGGYILDNYLAVQDAFSLTIKDWTTIARNGILGSWCDEARTKHMLASLEMYVTEFEST